MVLLAFARGMVKALRPMTPAEFKKKWAKFSGKESAAYAEHFNDLCRMLGLPTPIEADPTGNDDFCFQKRVAKDAELFDFDTSGSAEPVKHDRGFADVWKRDCFGWEYKGPGEDLEKAYKQLLRYRESLLNPPLLIVCDFKRFIVRTNFNGAVQETHEFTIAEIDSPGPLRVLRAALSDPEWLRPQRTAAEVTEKLAAQIASVALSLQKRESVELADARTRRQHTVAQKKNLRIAQFLNRLVFCFFAEDTGLLPERIFADVCKAGLEDPVHFTQSLEDLFRAMAKGGRFGVQKIRHFNGHLFEDATVFELTGEEIRTLADAAESDWESIQPSIMGTLFERALDEGQRSQLGAHYTSEEDIKTLIEPVLMAPLRQEWRELRKGVAPAILKGKGTDADRKKLAAFQEKLASMIVLDPACGSGNFLYVSLQLLLGLEKEVITAAAQIEASLTPKVTIQQLRAIEINPYAYELAQASVQIGFLQWRRENGFDNDRTPVLQNLDGFENKDALLNESFRKKPKSLKAAQAEEHSRQDDLFKVYTERAWPVSDVIVGNPPFLHSSKFLRELGEDYRKYLFEVYKHRVPGFADLCCYWFEKARQQLEDGACRRAGLLATQAIRGGASRDVLRRIKETGNIFFAESDRNWTLAGANVHVSMVGFDNGTETHRVLDGKEVKEIHANLTAGQANLSIALKLAVNEGVSCYGSQQKAPFDITPDVAFRLLEDPNPNRKPNSDVVKPSLNGKQVLRRTPETWVIDFGSMKEISDAAKYAGPFGYVEEKIFPLREKHREAIQRRYWWLHARPSTVYRQILERSQEVLVTPTVSKHRIFLRLPAVVLADHQLVVFSRADDFFFGVLQSRAHEVWTRVQGTQVRERESGFRYTPTTCFETFPFPDPSLIQCEAVADAAKELSMLRENWLNPPEWTASRTLTFPGSTDGPWRRFVRDADARGIGTVVYPLTEPRDAECGAKLAKRTLTNLYNERPAWLANAHGKLDAAVAKAYGWPADLSDDEILSRLLALNLQRAAAEAARVAESPPKRRMTREKTADEML